MSRRIRVRFTGDPDLQTWEGHPKRDEYRAANDGLGMCNTGSGKPLACVFGGPHCDTDHVEIARMNLRAGSSKRAVDSVVRATAESLEEKGLNAPFHWHDRKNATPEELEAFREEGRAKAREMIAAGQSLAMFIFTDGLGGMGVGSWSDGPASLRQEGFDEVRGEQGS